MATAVPAPPPPPKTVDKPYYLSAHGVSFVEHLEALAAEHARMEAELRVWKAECDRLRCFCTSSCPEPVNGRPVCERDKFQPVCLDDLLRATGGGVDTSSYGRTSSESSSARPSAWRSSTTFTSSSPWFATIGPQQTAISCKREFPEESGQLPLLEPPLFPIDEASASPRSSPRSSPLGANLGPFPPKVKAAPVKPSAEFAGRPFLMPSHKLEMLSLSDDKPAPPIMEQCSPTESNGGKNVQEKTIEKQDISAKETDGLEVFKATTTSLDTEPALGNLSLPLKEGKDDLSKPSELKATTGGLDTEHALDGMPLPLRAAATTDGLDTEHAAGNLPRSFTATVTDFEPQPSVYHYYASKSLLSLGAATDTVENVNLRGVSLRGLVLAGANPRISTMPRSLEFKISEESSTEKVWACTRAMHRVNLHLRAKVYKLLMLRVFDGFIGCIIVLDGVLLGLEAQNDLKNFMAQDDSLRVAGYIFKGIFFTELCLRCYAVGIVASIINSWIRFDMLLVFCSVTDLVAEKVVEVDDEMLTSMVVLRVFRLARLVRAARLMVQFRNLWLLISGLRASFGTIMWTFLLLFLISYTFAVLGMEVMAPRGLSKQGEFNKVASEQFGGLPQAMLTLLQVVTLDSIAAIYRPLILDPQGMPFFGTCYFVTYILFVSVALMNLVTAVMVEGSMQQADADREAMAAMEEKRKKHLMPKLREMFEALDEDKSGEVSLYEIESAPKELKDELKCITKVDDLTEIFHLLDDDDSGSVMIDEFLDGILKASSGDVRQNLQMQRIMKQIGQLRQKTHDELTDTDSFRSRKSRKSAFNMEMQRWRQSHKDLANTDSSRSRKSRMSNFNSANAAKKFSTRQRSGSG